MRPGRLLPLILGGLLFAIPDRAGQAGGQKFPPVARVSVLSDEALVGETVRFSAAGSTDPDSGPLPLSYFWEFGDGETSALVEPEHAFRAARAYPVTLTVDDGAETSATVAVVHVLDPPLPGSPASAGPLALSPDGESLWAVNEDSDSVTVVALAAQPPGARKARELRTGRRPRTLTFSADGSEVYVACQESNGIWVLDRLGKQSPRVVTVGHEPYGVATAPGGRRVAVTLQGQSEVAILEAGSLAPRKRLAVAPFPRAIAIHQDGRRALVTHFLSVDGVGRVSLLDLEDESLIQVIDLPMDPGPDTPSSGRGVPNLLGAAAIEPGGGGAWMGGLKSNIARGLLRDGQPLTPQNRVRGFLLRVDLLQGAESVERRIDLNDADTGSAVAFSPRGRHAYVTHQGTGDLSVYDLSAATLVRPGQGSTVPFLSRIHLGEAPRAIVLDSTGRRGYALCFLSRAVVVLDLSDPRSPVVEEVVDVTEERLSGPIARGKRLFFRSSPPRHSKGGYIACASCHPDGGMQDAQTWDFSDAGEGLRNTIDLRGRGGMAHGPVHWSANFDEIQDFENDIVKGSGGPGWPRTGTRLTRRSARPTAAGAPTWMTWRPMSPFSPWLPRALTGTPTARSREPPAAARRSSSVTIPAAPPATSRRASPTARSRRIRRTTSFTTSALSVREAAGGWGVRSPGSTRPP